MNIYVKVSKFYDFVPTSQDDAEKQMADGSYAKRIIINVPSETTVIVSDQQIKNLTEASAQLVNDEEFMLQHPEYKQLTEKDIVAEEFRKAMLLQAPRDAWEKIEVHDNKPMAKFLTNKFLKGENNEN